VWVKVFPAGTELPNEPSSAVTVWVTESLLVQTTVLLTPMTTVIEAGLNEKFWIAIFVVLCAAATGADWVANKPTEARIETRSSRRPALAGTRTIVEFGVKVGSWAR